MKFLLALFFFVVGCRAVTNCGIGTDPFFATVSFSPSEDMWRADSLIVEYEENGERHATYPQQHWETRTIDRQCVIHRTVYLPVDRFVLIYKQKIFPAVENAYQVQEYMPHTQRYTVVDCRVQRLDSRTINITSTFTLERQITIDEPHESYNEHVRMLFSDTTTSFKALPRVMQNATIAETRALFEQGLIVDMVLDPMPAFVHKLY